MGGQDEDWKKIKIDAGVVSIPNPKSSKKRKHDSAKGTADAIHKNQIDGKAGVHDPKGLIAKLKAKKKKQK